MTGIMGSWQDSLPVLVISGQVRYETTIEASGLPLRYRGVQEFDIVNSIGNMTKYAVMVKDPLAIRRVLQKAIDLALNGRRGPVWIDIPMNIQSAIIEVNDLYPVEELDPLPCVSVSEIEDIVKTLNNAKRPCLLVGNGVANSNNIPEFRKFAELTGVPVIAAAIAADAMYRDNDLFFGMSGSIGPRPGNFIVQNADVIVSLGCTIGYKMTGFAQEYFAPKAHIIMIDIDKNEAKKPGVRIDQLIHSDLGLFFKRANDIVTKINVDPQWMEYCQKLKARFSLFEAGENKATDERVCSYYFWKEYEKYEPSDSTSILGNNSANSAKLQIGIKKPEQRIVANNNGGAMGADLPEAIGAAVATGREVICLTGDGSIMMNLQELQTIIHYKLPVKVVVFSNDGYNAVRQTCKNYFNGKYIGCTADTGVSFPSFQS